MSKLFNFVGLLIIISNLIFTYAATDCSKIRNNDVLKCACYLRKETKLVSSQKSCGNNNLYKFAKNYAQEACNNISYCRDAYAHADNWCPKAGGSCVAGCLWEIAEAFRTRSESKSIPFCIYSGLRTTGYWCNTKGNNKLNNQKAYFCNSDNWV